MKKNQLFKHLLFIFMILCSTLFMGCTNQQSDDNNQKEQISLQKRARWYVENLSNGNYQPVYNKFTQEVKNQLSLENLQAAWESLINSYGTLEGIVNSTHTIEQGYQVIYVTCSFSTLGKLDIKFVFDDQERIAGFQFVPTKTSDEYTTADYVDHSTFTEHNITFGASPWELPGTLCIPMESGPVPAVVLVHGSGPNDRDETIGPNKPFKDIAEGLATKGIMVLRYDKRTYAHPEESAALTNITPQDEVITDALAAISYIQHNKAENISSIFLLGHSLGAMMAPEIARQTTLLDGVIMLAAPARSFEDLYLAQYTYLASLDGIIDKQEQQQIDSVNQSVQKIKTLNISSNETVFNLPLSYWIYLSNYHPIETTQNLTIPMFLLQGKRDYQVTYEDDFLIWKNTFKNTSRITLQSYETLNHLFISGTGTATNTEYLKSGNVEETVIKDLYAWITSELEKE